jgi:hypothetical protein
MEKAELIFEVDRALAWLETTKVELESKETRIRTARRLLKELLERLKAEA